MDDERLRRVRAVFHSALDQESSERPAFLDRSCGGDADLRRQVELLLAKVPEVGSFLETPASLTQSTGGTLLGREFGPYRIVSQIGAGGMGEVYRAHDNTLSRDVAIKTLPAEFADDPEWLSRFRREARTLASLNHPNIGAIYGLQESGDLHALVLELVEGETMRGPLPVARALEFARQVAEAIEAAHEKGIIHRDLKPANVKVTPKGTVKVLDFGLAKAVWGSEVRPTMPRSQAQVTDSVTLTGHVLGTPGYMSPEQARGETLDQRTDIWAFGCLLFELLSGKRAFPGDTGPETIAAVLESEPDWHALPPKTPARIRELLRHCLQKDAARRLSTIVEARRAMEPTQHGRSRWQVAVAAGIAVLAAGASLYWRGPARPPDRTQWFQLTKFSDPVSQPAFSPDGKRLAFVRGARTEFGRGQIYVRDLPDGEPVQLTNDDLRKATPVFTPDGQRIVYTVVDSEFNWNAWIVPVAGGEPRQWMQDAADVSWAGKESILFSTHMHPKKIVMAREDRTGAHDVYVPRNDREMPERPRASPDGKWALVPEVGTSGSWEQCRVFSMDGRFPARLVGPRGAACTGGAWSRDGKWIYLTAKAGGLNHIWRQRFPDGEPQPFTSGITEEEGVAMAPDGRSLVTAVALETSSLWVHDAHGERQISTEGNAAFAKFSPDGTKLFYRVLKAVEKLGTKRDPGELWVADVESGRSEHLAPGLEAVDYDVSRDGKQVAMDVPDGAGRHLVWLATVDRSSPPRQLPNGEGYVPVFGPDGDIYFRRLEGSSQFLYRIHPDGTGLRKAFGEPIFYAYPFSPDGKWMRVWGPLPGQATTLASKMVRLDGGPPVIIGSTTVLEWPTNGDSIWIWMGAVPDGKTYVVPLAPGQVMPRVPAGGFHSEQEVAALPGARCLDVEARPGPSKDIYNFERHTVQRNLYRIPIP